MREQFGATLADLEPGTRLIKDLEMDDFEPVELRKTCEGDLAILIPAKEFEENLTTLGGLIAYLHTRVESPLVGGLLDLEHGAESTISCGVFQETEF